MTFFDDLIMERPGMVLFFADLGSLENVANIFIKQYFIVKAKNQKSYSDVGISDVPIGWVEAKRKAKA